jgi:hypothetical protein
MRSINIVFSFLFFIISNSFCIDIKTITSEIDNLVGTEFHGKYKIINIIEAKTICAVFIEPPYREFPNVILFKFNDGRYQRIIEGLTIGIIDSASDILDLHTKGKAIDMKFDTTGNYNFQSNSIIKLIKLGMNKNNPLTIYSNFIHMHPLPGIKGFYTIDKTNFLNIAEKVFTKKNWDDYPKTECTMYDLPKMLKMNFEFIDDRFVLTVETDNNQKWQILFCDADNENQFLLDKKIEVKLKSTICK